MDVAGATTGQHRVSDEVGERCQKLFQDFLEKMKDKYLDQAAELIKPERNCLKIDFNDIALFSIQLSDVIVEEYYRVYPYLCRAIKNFVKDFADVNVPNKEYYLSLTDVPTRFKVRDLSTTKVGTLIKISGQIVRTHPVHPELVSGTFKCLDCATIVKDVEQQFKYTQPSICTNQACANRSRFVLEPKSSRFVDFQKIRIQETQIELPRGSIPRSMEVIVRAEAVELAQAGDRCDFIGTLVVVPDVGALNLPGAKAESGARNRGEREGGDNEGLQGLKALGVRDLNYRLAFLACCVQPSNPKFAGREWFLEDISKESLRKQMSDEEWAKVFSMSQDKHLLPNLMNSLFPTIHGNDEVKKGLLLMLFGGVPKVTTEKTALRGDINICIVGDPSVAKSQFLKQIAEFSPRAVYTSGKASSAAGLTAAVVRDEESFEFVIEAGALMLADNGVCCIDEFDKMDPRDQVAIHEAMEQQTISITKAGVKATLNARTSILAAANPIGGRYDRGKSLRQNINLGAPILSRFDLFFILIDDTNEVMDYAIARKIVNLHSNMEESIDRVYSREEILRYILFARQFKPKLSKEAAKLLIKCYKNLRQRDAGVSTRTAWRITVRQLESLIRLSEAMARMACHDKVTVAEVEDAYRLLNKSIIRVEQPDINLDGDEEEKAPDAGEEDEDEVLNTSQQSADGGEGQEDMETESHGDSHSIADSRPESLTQKKKKKLKLSFEEYKSMSNLLILYMRREESKAEDAGVESEGLRRSHIVDWYLNEIGDSIDTEQELVEKSELVHKVIDRLIHVDNVIIPLVSSQLQRGQQAPQEDDDPLLVVHPNHILDF